MPVTRFRSSPVSKYRISIQCCRHRLSPFTRCLAVVLPWVSLAFITAKWNQHEKHTFQSFSYAECGFPHSGYRSGSLALYLIHEFLFLNFQIHRISTLSFRLSSINKSDNMLHSPSGFPSRISCRIIGCDFLSLDTFTYCLLKAVSCKYHVANLYCAGDFWAHTVARDCLPGIFEKCF